MTEKFDPYHEWLGIHPKEQPPNHYRLLGINLFEEKTSAIDLAVERLMTQLRTFQIGKNSDACQKLLNEVAAARVCLLNSKRKVEYDQRLRTELEPDEPIDNLDADADTPKPSIQLSSEKPTSKSPSRSMKLALLGLTGCVLVFFIGAILFRVFNRQQEETVAPANIPIDIPAVPVFSPPETSVVLLWPVGERSDATVLLDGQAFDPNASTIDSNTDRITLPLSSGEHQIEITREGYEPFKATLTLSDAEQKELTTEWIPVRPKDGRGLRGEYFAGANFDRKVLTRIDPQLDFFWDTQPPNARVPADDFSIRWTGWLKAPKPGEYVLTVYRDDGVRVWVDENLVIDLFEEGKVETPDQVTIDFSDKPHALKIEHHEGRGVAACCLNWSRPGEFGEQTIPREALFLDEQAALDASTESIQAAIRKGGEPFNGSWVEGEPIDLLPRIDLERDIIRGAWWFDRDVLLSGVGKLPLIQVPVTPPTEYEVEFVVERVHGRDSFIINLPTSEKSFEVNLDGYSHQYSGVVIVDGFRFNHENNPTRYSGQVLTNGKPATVKCLVRENHLQVSVDGTSIIDWEGESSRCSLHPDCSKAGARRLFLAAYDSVFRISQLRLTPLTSQKQSPDPTTVASKDPANPAKTTPQPIKMQPVPPKADQAKAMALIDETFDIEKATTSAKKLELARQLLELGQKPGSEPAEQFVLFRKASELALAAGDAELMLSAVDAMVDQFEMGSVNVKGKLLVQFAKQGKNKTDVDSLIDLIPSVIDEMLDVDRPDAARAVVDAVYDMAVRLRATNHRKALHERRQAVNEIHKTWLANRANLAILEKNPDDPEANLAVGRHACFVESDWKAGLPMLAKSGDPRLSSIAHQELAIPSEPSTQLQLADAWWDAAGSEPTDLRPTFQHRAGHWYRQALAHATSFAVKGKCMKRLEELKAVPDPKSTASVTTLKQTSSAESLAVRKWFDVLKPLEPEKDVVRGRWTRNGTDIATSRDMPSTCMLPVVVHGNYDLKVEFTRTVGDDAVYLLLPVGVQQCALYLSDSKGAAGGLATIDSHDVSKNPTSVKPCILKNGDIYRIEVSVRLQADMASITAMVNGKPFCRWSGPQASLGISVEHGMPELMRPALGANDVEAVFHKADLKLTAGVARFLPPDRTRDDPFELRKAFGDNRGVAYRDIGPGGAHLVGLAISSGYYLLTVQPIYRTPNGDIPGGSYRSKPKKSKVDIAKQGYAIGGLMMKTSSSVHGFRIVYMRDRGDSLDPNDTYTSSWLGGTDGYENSLMSEGKPILGIHGTYCPHDVTSLGLIFSRQPTK